jgi:hypothetical protein
MDRVSGHFVHGFCALTALALHACANSPDESERREPIVAEPPCITSVRVLPPQRMAKGRGVERLPGARCPLLLSSVTVVSKDVDEGVALDFTTSGDIAELRHRVREIATTHSHDAFGGDDECGCPLIGNDGAPLMAEASTSAEPTPGGARLVLVPNERSEVLRLRARVSERLQRLAVTDCPVQR